MLWNVGVGSMALLHSVLYCFSSPCHLLFGLKTTLMSPRSYQITLESYLLWQQKSQLIWTWGDIGCGKIANNQWESAPPVCTKDLWAVSIQLVTSSTRCLVGDIHLSIWQRWGGVKGEQTRGCQIKGQLPDTRHRHMIRDVILAIPTYDRWISPRLWFKRCERGTNTRMQSRLVIFLQKQKSSK